jgi:hypothetical protein
VIAEAWGRPQENECAFLMQALKARLNNGNRHNQAWRRAEIDSRFVMILISLLPWALPEAKIEAAPSALNRHKRLQLGEQIEILRFGHAAAVVGGIEIRDAQAFEFVRLVANSLYDFRSDERLVIFDFTNAKLGHL